MNLSGGNRKFRGKKKKSVEHGGDELERGTRDDDVSKESVFEIGIGTKCCDRNACQMMS